MVDTVDIRELLSRRADLSTFVVHLTKDTSDGRSAKYNLKRILKKHILEARTPFGPASDQSLSLRKADRSSQNCVSFSETPLEHISCLTHSIPGRKIRLSSYGLAFAKMAARQRGVNPVWYVDITPGHDWLMKPINEMVRLESKNGRFRRSNLAQICPFIEQMGSGQRANGGTYRKEFWWEREWRHRGAFRFCYSDIAFGLAPEHDVERLETYTAKLTRRKIRFLDPSWNTEKMIAHLCGCRGVLTPFDAEE